MPGRVRSTPTYHATDGPRGASPRAFQVLSILIVPDKKGAPCGALQVAFGFGSPNYPSRSIEAVEEDTIRQRFKQGDRTAATRLIIRDRRRQVQ